MRKIVEGVRPKKPIFAITQGYTEELWGMTTACWEKDPMQRPTVDHVLGVLGSAAGRWKPKDGELAAQDDWSPTSPTEGSDPEHESEPLTPIREAETLEKARRMHIHPWIAVSNQRTTDVTRYSPRLTYHS